MNAWRSGPATAKTKHHAASRSSATTKLAGQPEQHEQDDVEDAADQQGARPASEEAAHPRAR